MPKIKTLVFEEKPTEAFGLKKMVHSEIVTGLTDFQVGIIAGKLTAKYAEEKHVIYIQTTKI